MCTAPHIRKFTSSLKLYATAVGTALKVLALYSMFLALIRGLFKMQNFTARLYLFDGNLEFRALLVLALMVFAIFSAAVFAVLSIDGEAPWFVS